LLDIETVPEFITMSDQRHKDPEIDELRKQKIKEE